MATLTVQTSAMSGAVLTMSAATSGATGSASADDFANDGRTFLIVHNGSGGPVVVTVNSATACDQGFDHDVAVTINAGVEKMIGPFTTARFGPSTTFWYDSVTSVTVAAVHHTA